MTRMKNHDFRTPTLWITFGFVNSNNTLDQKCATWHISNVMPCLACFDPPASRRHCDPRVSGGKQSIFLSAARKMDCHGRFAASQ
jgi:hypothetical protein